VSKVRILAVLTMCNALSPLALQILVPALPSIRNQLGVSLAETQLLLSTFSIALAVSMLAYGPLADRMDRKRLLVFGMITFSLGSLLGYSAGTIQILVAARILQAIGAGAASTITRAIAADTFQGSDLNRAMSAMLFVVVIGPMLAPVVGGYIVETSRWPNIMLLLLGMGGVLGLTAALFLTPSRSTKRDATTGESYWIKFSAIVGNRIFSTNMATLIAVQVGVYAFISASPYLIIDLLKYSATQYGFVFMYLTMGYMSGNFVSGMVVKKIGGEKLVQIASLVYLFGAVSFLGFAILGIQNLLTIAGPAFLLTFTNGITQPNCGAGALASVEQHKGIAASLSGVGQILAGAVGFQIMGFVQIASAKPLAIVISACSAVAVISARFLSKPIPIER
jgi:MFS transporter, DHA1 family, multidrug resistance protein